MEETQDPARADRVYESCVHFLLERTRDHKQFPLVVAENVNYGFRRNVWALKPFGIVSATIGMVSCATCFLLRLHEGAGSIAAIGFLISLALFLLWVFVFKPDWVRSVAYSYAGRLLGSLDGM